ncbi:hypothetical protein C5C31_13115 [Rathayibacter rathayi]|uniref:Uncharacterized protein n=1 Tax=Rathayibacter rathayi TaxID=33887 RepID=A0ABX5A8W0_RATRA|nr:hypothetical protein [Rathayibacter rathayi]MWV75896.1 hypothetical protein [Rathayibacter rathayi NCPPB 2980 = VKM Ac-1601]PPF23008.1 hypothetical protein C5C34_10155 [Rathayibacter rathayi]PPF44728.1 hypothetical protein C5C08_12890 [Rathayibacter rathayi]PPF77368.1 hypothetical protein C5C14_12565 [Rathayibacter rathayi]PPG11472.1 hypothetical protein C5C11_12535 [Rathayibacter rathayi]
MKLDAAYVSPASRLAERDGWTPLAWVTDPVRTVHGDPSFDLTPELLSDDPSKSEDAPEK